MKLVIAVLACVAVAASANQINTVQIFTHDCYNCGMNVLLGQLSLQVCNAFGNCCVTGTLDNVGSNDFERNSVSSFRKDTIGPCNNFELGSTTSSQLSMVLTHSGKICSRVFGRIGSTYFRSYSRHWWRSVWLGQGVHGNRFLSMRLQQDPGRRWYRKRSWMLLRKGLTRQSRQKTRCKASLVVFYSEIVSQNKRLVER